MEILLRRLNFKKNSNFCKYTINLIKVLIQINQNIQAKDSLKAMANQIQNLKLMLSHSIHHNLFTQVLKVKMRGRSSHMMRDQLPLKL